MCFAGFYGEESVLRGACKGGERLYHGNAAAWLGPRDRLRLVGHREMADAIDSVP